MSARRRALRAENPTIKEIAARLGVSHSTASRALNNLAPRKGVTRASARRWSRPASRLTPPRPSSSRRGRLLARRPKRLLRRKSRPTALVIASPQLTVGALEAIRKTALTLPRGVSLLSYGDATWFRFWKPGITAVALVPARDAATTCGSLLFRRMRADKAEVEDSRSARVALGTHLVVRGSTAAPGRA